MCVYIDNDNSFCCNFMKFLNWAHEGKRQGYDTMFIAEDHNLELYPIYVNIDTTLGLELKIDRRVAKCIRLKGITS